MLNLISSIGESSLKNINTFDSQSGLLFVAQGHTIDHMPGKEFLQITLGLGTEVKVLWLNYTISKFKNWFPYEDRQRLSKGYPNQLMNNL